MITALLILAAILLVYGLLGGGKGIDPNAPITKTKYKIPPMNMFEDD